MESCRLTNEKHCIEPHRSAGLVWYHQHQLAKAKRTKVSLSLSLSLSSHHIKIPHYTPPSPFFLRLLSLSLINHIIPLPFNTNTATTAPTTKTKTVPQNAQHMYARCLLFRCCPSSQLLSLQATGSASMVVQNLNADLGRPERETPRLRREGLLWAVVKREERLGYGEGEGKVEEEVEVGSVGVGGREGGCEDSAKRKREARREKRVLFARGVEGAEGRAKCADFGVVGVEGWLSEEGKAGVACEGRFRSAIMSSSAIFSSGASKYTLLDPLVAALFRVSLLDSTGGRVLAGAETGRVKAVGGNAGEKR